VTSLDALRVAFIATAVHGLTIWHICSDGCPWDCGDRDGNTGMADLLALLRQWGGGPCDTGDDGVDERDLVALLAAFGPCP
jgi:hypothetical protein